MRSVRKGSISFGLVNIPVAVYPATREEKIAFKQLRKSDLSPIRYKKVAEADDKEVPGEQIVKGYEYEKGKWVVVEEKDLSEIEIEFTHVINITDFIQAADANQQPYFLEAQKSGEKSYALLHRALVETGKIGRRQGRDPQPRIPVRGQAGWALPDVGADAFRQRRALAR